MTGSGFSSSGNTQQANQAQLQHELSNFGSKLAGLGVTYLLLVIAGQILTGMLTVVVAVRCWAARSPRARRGGARCRDSRPYSAPPSWCASSSSACGRSTSGSASAW